MILPAICALLQAQTLIAGLRPGSSWAVMEMELHDSALRAKC